MENDIKKGDIVKLKSDNDNLVRFTVGEDGDRKDEVYVYWYRRPEGELRKMTIPKDCLVKLKS